MQYWTCKSWLGTADVAAINEREAARRYLVEMCAGKGLQEVEVAPRGSSRKPTAVSVHWSRQRR